MSSFCRGVKFKRHRAMVRGDIRFFWTEHLNIQSAPASPSKAVGIKHRNPPKPSMMPASMPLRVTLRLVKVITSDFLLWHLLFLSNTAHLCVYSLMKFLPIAVDCRSAFPSMRLFWDLFFFLISWLLEHCFGFLLVVAAQLISGFCRLIFLVACTSLGLSLILTLCRP